MPASARSVRTRHGRGLRGRSWVGLALLAVATLGASPRGTRAEPVEPTDDDSTPMVTLDALPLGAPLDRLDDGARALVDSVLASSLFSHRVTGLRAASREPVFRFLLDHPDFSAAVARALRLGKYRVEARDGGYWGGDTRGARGMVRGRHADA